MAALESDGLFEGLRKKDGVVLVSGFVSTTKDGRFRIHPWIDPHAYLEFDADDIVQSTPIDKKVSPLGGSVVLLKSTAQVKRVIGTRRSAEADFLAGDIVIGALKDADDVEPPTLAFGWTVTTVTTVTTTTVPITATWALGCFTDWVCDTGTMRCLGSTMCTTGALACVGTIVAGGQSSDWMCNSHYCESEGANCPTLSGCGGGGGGDDDGGGGPMV